MRVPRRAYLYRALLEHPGIGLVATRSDEGRGAREHARARGDRAGERAAVECSRERIRSPRTEPRAPWCARCATSSCSRTPATLCCSAPTTATTSCRSTIRSARTAAPGGDQVYPFIITPPDLDLERRDDRGRARRASGGDGAVRVRYAVLGRLTVLPLASVAACAGARYAARARSLDARSDERRSRAARPSERQTSAIARREAHRRTPRARSRGLEGGADRSRTSISRSRGRRAQAPSSPFSRLLAMMTPSARQKAHCGASDS